MILLARLLLLLVSLLLLHFPRYSVSAVSPRTTIAAKAIQRPADAADHSDDTTLSFFRSSSHANLVPQRPFDSFSTAQATLCSRASSAASSQPTGEDHDRRRKRTSLDDDDFPQKTQQQPLDDETTSLLPPFSDPQRIHLEDACHSLSPNLWVVLLRGGGGRDKDRKQRRNQKKKSESKDNDNNNNNDNNKDEPTTEEDTTTMENNAERSPSPPQHLTTTTTTLSSPLSLFQRNNNVLAETIAQGNKGDDVDFAKNRGGALVKTIVPPSSSTRPRGFFAWFSSPVEEAEREATTTTDLEDANSNRRKLEQAWWWNNAWTDVHHGLDDDDKAAVDHHEGEGRIYTASSGDDDDDDNDEQVSNDIVIVLDDNEEEEEGNNSAQKEGVVALVETTREETADVVIVAEEEEEPTKPPQKKKRKNRKHNKHAKSVASDPANVGESDTAPGTPGLNTTTAEGATATSQEDTNGTAADAATTTTFAVDPSPYTSSGAWKVVDALLTLGYSLDGSSAADIWKPSRSLRPVRKALARVTGWHGVLSGKPRELWTTTTSRKPARKPSFSQDFAKAAQEHERRAMLQKRLASIDRARGNVARVEAEKMEASQPKRGPFWRSKADQEDAYIQDGKPFVKNAQAWERERLKHERLEEIDTLMTQGAERLAELATEKNLLQNMLNPLFNYSTTYDELDETRQRQEAELLAYKEQEEEQNSGENSTASSSPRRPGRLSFEEKLNQYQPVIPQKEFNFPSDDLVDEYLDMLFSSGRLVKMNHTDLWKNNGFGNNNAHDDDDYDEEEDDDEEWLTTQERAERNQRRNDRRGRRRNEQDYYRNLEQSGSRWLRNGLGEKIGVAIEMVAYKAVCANVMGILAKSLSAMHGANVMGHADICVRAEFLPVLPSNLGPSTESYASQAFYNAISSSSSSSKKKKKRKKKTSEDSVQRHAVVETLLSQCQVACPLLKLFPLAWQRSFLGNLVTMITSVLSDFLEGLEFQILGHRLEFTFQPITEQDMLKRMAQHDLDSDSFRNAPHPARSHQAFEAAVQATTLDMSKNLQFLDKWHERVLGGDSIRTQIAALIARVVLSLVDDILSQSRMDLWSHTNAGGPRLVTGLYYRTPPTTLSTMTTSQTTTSSSSDHHHHRPTTTRTE